MERFDITTWCIVVVTLIYMLCIASHTREYNEIQAFDEYILNITWQKPSGYYYVNADNENQQLDTPIFGTDLLNYDIHIYQSPSNQLEVNTDTMKPKVSVDEIMELKNVYAREREEYSTDGSGNSVTVITYGYTKQFSKTKRGDTPLKANHYIHVFIRAHIEGSEPGAIGSIDYPKLVDQNEMVIDRKPQEPKNIVLTIVSTDGNLERVFKEYNLITLLSATAPLPLGVELASESDFSYELGNEPQVTPASSTANSSSTTAPPTPPIIPYKNLEIISSQSANINIFGFYRENNNTLVMEDIAKYILTREDWDYCAVVYLGFIESMGRHKYLRIVFKKGSEGSTPNDVLNRLFNLVSPVTSLTPKGVSNVQHYNNGTTTEFNYKFNLYSKVEVNPLAEE